MIEFPIDPTPFVIPYAIIIFLLPWIICASFMIRNMAFLSKKGLLNWGLDFEKQKLAREFMKSDPQARSLYKQLKRWMIITIALWVGGFAVLGTTLYLMEENDLLINHSKGLYGPNENK